MLAGGCFGDTDLNTDLRSEGPPAVLAVLAQSGVDLTEFAAFCRYVDGNRDPKAPGFVGDPVTGGGIVCPEVQTEFEAAALDPRFVEPNVSWAIRIMFDELLDPSVEDLVCPDDDIRCFGTIAETRPVTLTCGGVAMPYDGYYVPNGNNVSFPLGPSLYVKPALDALPPAGSDCTIVIDPKVTDKQGNPVAEADRTLTVSVEPLRVAFTDPEDAEDVADRAELAPDDVVAFVFNAVLDEASVTAADVEVLDSTGAPVAGVVVAVDGANVPGDALLIAHGTGFAPGEYTARLKAGAEIAEARGGTLTVSANRDVRFVVVDK
ncbi:MAG TPA: hypothetical protein VM734_20280 [Kofleriaceae bacterium]|jgi:hypothetical protein|nr:hypothetical protein [Kofleriaceae bacterium]